MRAYFFGNMYLPGIHAGIQSAHSLHEMFVKYHNLNLAVDDHVEGNCNQWNILMDWAQNHKTIVVLNARYAAELRTLIAYFSQPQNPFPWAKFNESIEALDGALTNVGIVLPAEIYDTAKELRTGGETESLHMLPDGSIQAKSMYPNLTPYELSLAQLLNNYGLAT